MKLTAEEISLLVKLLNIAVDRIGRQTGALKALQARGDILGDIARLLSATPAPGKAATVEVALSPAQEEEIRTLVGPQPAMHVASLVPKLFGEKRGSGSSVA